jgi:hypothetical protein
VAGREAEAAGCRDEKGGLVTQKGEGLKGHELGEGVERRVEHSGTERRRAAEVAVRRSFHRRVVLRLVWLKRVG